VVQDLHEGLLLGHQNKPKEGKHNRRKQRAKGKRAAEKQKRGRHLPDQKGTSETRLLHNPAPGNLTSVKS